MNKSRAPVDFVLAFAFLALATQMATAYDPSPLQDFCVAVDEPKNGLFINGKFCKDPKSVETDDFSISGLHIPASTDNEEGFNETGVSVDRFPGLNTLGLSAARFDFAPYGINPPHINPRASEILVVREGTLYVGFVWSDYDRRNRLFCKVLKKGDVFVFPIGLPHFQMNIGKTPAAAYSAFNSQNPGKISIPIATFGTDPPIDPELLAKAFRLDKKVIKYLQARFQNKDSSP